MVAGPALLALATFANTLWNGFVYDDLWVVGRLDSLSQQPVGAFLTSSRRLTYLVHVLDGSIWGTWAPGFHATNVALHALATALTVCAAKAITRSTLAAFFCGVLFAVHPVHVESVASIANRKDILALIFVLLALLMWLRPHRSVLCYLGVGVSLALGMLAKEVAAIGLFPMLLFADSLLDVEGNPPILERIVAMRWGALFLLLAGAGGILVFAGNLMNYFSIGSIRANVGHGLHGYTEVLATSLASTPSSARLMFWPVRLSADYPLTLARNFASPAAVLGLGILVGWFLSALGLARRAPKLAFAMAWIPVTYLPSANFVPLTKFFVADRYLYVPSFGVCLLVGLLLCGGITVLQR